MKGFLQEVAETVIHNYKNFREIEIIVPNRRTSLFLKKYISESISETIWMPSVTTIKDIFYSNSDLKDAEEIILIYRLYKIFVKHTGTNESFDDFYYWGEIILGDFDNIDKYLVDADKLFSTVVDIKQIDAQFDGYEEDAIDIIKKFWHNVNQAQISKHKESFLELWRAMSDIYKDYKIELSKDNIAYQGMIYRDVVNHISNLDFEKSDYLIIGFNALNKCEKAIFKHLKVNNNTSFFWDADKYYIDDKYQEAGRFIRENIKLFGAHPKIDIGNNIKDLKKNIEVIMAPSPVSQTKMIAEILEEWVKQDDFIPEKTAIILGDENLLIPLMYSIPNSVEPYNVSMGYPVKNSMSSDFISHLVNLQKHAQGSKANTKFYFKDVLALLNHSFLQVSYSKEVKAIEAKLIEDKYIYIEAQKLQQNDFLSMLFAKCENDVKSISSYMLITCTELLLQIADNQDFYMEVEFLNRISKRLNALNLCIIEDNIEFLKPDIYFKLISDFIRTLTIAFEGEPLEGMQVLGFLETRSLDFDRVIMLSINEGVFPKKSTAQSLIPYNLRKFHELPSIEYQDSIFAYYFYRLFQKSKDIRIIYSSQGGDANSEASRFITQLKYELNHNIKFRSDGYKVIIDTKKNSFAKKTKIDIEKIKQHFNAGISPSAINTYINCKFSYYLNYIKGIKEPETIEEEENSAFFGSLFHDIMQTLYSPFIGKVMNESDFDKIDKVTIEGAVFKVIKEAYKIRSEEETQRFRKKIIVDIVVKYIYQMLKKDKSTAPLTIVSLEDSHEVELKLASNQKVKIKGMIDRVDLVNGVYRVLDYKTGKTELSADSIQILFDTESKKRNKIMIQILLYALMYKNSNPNNIVLPGIIDVNKLNDSLDYSIKINKTKLFPFSDETRKELTDELNILFTEMLNPEVDFTQNQIIDNCKYCPYLVICNK